MCVCVIVAYEFLGKELLCIRCDVQCMLCVTAKQLFLHRAVGHLCVCMCVCVWGQTASYRCHSQRQRKTLMLVRTDTYLTPLSLTLTLLQADICVLVCRTVISHQTLAPKHWPTAHSSAPQHFLALPPYLPSFFSSLLSLFHQNTLLNTYI